VYASNVVTLRGWCERYKMKVISTVVKDDYDCIVRAINKIYAETDALITSGGAWTGERDLVGKVLEGLDWKKAFHRIRIVPGKGVGFGMLGKKPVFILPGGPTSNLMGFLQIALPGLQALSGYKKPGLPGIYAKMGSELRGRETDWTEFFLGYIESDGELPTFFPLKKKSRLKSIANATAVAAMPEGEDISCLDSIRYIQLLK
ncbi:MAG TPA: molybdopterin molybdenumtransferase MoeA, partial [Desulfobacteraceae bacterium]|nr:molybdopterin molybdenumtransferase MoeA [Desulfobacteraceae bacterium]